MEQDQRPRPPFPNQRMVKGFEGGAIYAAEQDGKAYVIQDESMMADLLIPGEDDDLIAALSPRVQTFDTVAERDDYLRQRGWQPDAHRRPRRLAGGANDRS